MKNQSTIETETRGGSCAPVTGSAGPCPICRDPGCMGNECSPPLPEEEDDAMEEWQRETEVRRMASMGNKEVITVKPFMQVKKLEQLAYLSEMKRSVVCPAFSSWSKPKPAAFIFCLPASRVLKLIEKGLYVYVPKEKPKYKTWTPKRN